jgi:hypothetical protein
LALSNPKRAGFEADDSLDIQLAVDEWSVPFSDVAAESSGIISDLDNFLEGTPLYANSEYASLCSLSEPDKPFELVMFVFRNAENGGGNRWVNYVLAEGIEDTVDDNVSAVTQKFIRREFGKTEQLDPDNDRIPVGRHVVALVDKCLAYSSKDDQDKVGNLACEVIEGKKQEDSTECSQDGTGTEECNICKFTSASDATSSQDPRNSTDGLAYAYIDIFPNTRPIVTPLAGLTSSTNGD